MQRLTRLPARFPANTKYVLEARGRHVHRHIEFPNGRIVELSPRMAASCDCADQTLVPAMDPSDDKKRRQPVAEIPAYTSRAKPMAPATAKIHSGLARVK